MSLLKSILSFFLFSISLYYIAIFVNTEISAFSLREFPFSCNTIAFVTLITMLAHFINSVMWWRLGLRSKITSDFFESYKAFSNSRLARYAPGKILVFASRAMAHNTASKITIASAMIIEFLASFTLTLLFGLVGLLLYDDKLSIDIVQPLTLKVLSFVALAALISLIALRNVFKNTMQIFEAITLKNLFSSILLLLPVYILHGSAFWLLLQTNTTPDISGIFLIVSIYYIAALIGQTAIFIPAGLGVREATLLALLSHAIAVDSTVLGFSIITIRLILIFSEIVHSLIASILFTLTASKK